MKEEIKLKIQNIKQEPAGEFLLILPAFQEGVGSAECVKSEPIEGKSLKVSLKKFDDKWIRKAEMLRVLLRM